MDVQTNHILRRPVPDVYIILCGNVLGLAGNFSDLRLSMIYCCALRLWSQICITCRGYWFPVSVALAVLLSMGRCLGPVEGLHTYEMVTEYFDSINLSVVVAKCWFLGCVV